MGDTIIEVGMEELQEVGIDDFAEVSVEEETTEDTPAKELAETESESTDEAVNTKAEVDKDIDAVILESVRKLYALSDDDNFYNSALNSLFMLLRVADADAAEVKINEFREVLKQTLAVCTEDKELPIYNTCTAKHDNILAYINSTADTSIDVDEFKAVAVVCLLSCAECIRSNNTYTSFYTDSEHDSFVDIEHMQMKNIGICRTSNIWEALICNILVIGGVANIDKYINACKEGLFEAEEEVAEETPVAEEVPYEGPCAAFKREICSKQGFAGFDEYLEEVMENLLSTHSQSLGCQNQGVLFIDEDGFGNLCRARFIDNKTVEFRTGIDHCLLMGTKSERGKVRDVLTSTAKVLDSYGYKTYTKRGITGAPTAEIVHHFDKNAQASSFIATVFDNTNKRCINTYLCNLQSCLTNRILVFFHEIEQNGEYGVEVEYRKVKAAKAADYCECFTHLFWWILYSNLETVDAFEELVKDYGNRSLKSLVQALIVDYGSSLFYNYTVKSVTDIMVEFEARFGICISAENIKASSFLNFVKEEGYYATEYAVVNKDALFAMPDSVAALKLNCKFIVDPDAFYATPDFGYHDNHKLYNKGVQRKAPVLLGKKINGGYMYTDVFTASDKFGLPIFSGSRSGKGVLTNNICDGWLARGYGIVYIDCKPEQATALWHFEEWFNRKYAAVLKDPLRLIAVDCKTDGSVLADKFGGGSAPRAQKLYGVPEFIEDSMFTKLCGEMSNQTQFCGNVQTGTIFTYIHAMKLLHLLMGYISVKSSAKEEFSELNRCLGNDFIYVVWDELENCYNTCHSAFDDARVFVIEATKLLKAKKERYEKAKTPEDEKEVLQKEMNLLKQAIAYFKHIVAAYHAWNTSPNDECQIGTGFAGLKTDTLKANVRFLTITQALPYADDAWPANGLYTLFSKTAYIEGKNAVRAGSTLNMHYEQLNAYKTNPETFRQAQLIRGDLSSLLTDGKTTSVPLCDPLESDGSNGISGYFGYVGAGGTSLEVFKSCLSLLDNDYDESREDLRAAPGGGACGLSIGDGAVAGLLDRSPASLRDYIVTHDIYKTSDDGTKELNAEIGFAGAADYLIQRTVENVPCWEKDLQKLVDSINKTYDNLLFCLNFFVRREGLPEYETLESYLADMSYKGMLTITPNGLKIPDDLKVYCNLGSAAEGFTRVTNIPKTIKTFGVQQGIDTQPTEESKVYTDTEGVSQTPPTPKARKISNQPAENQEPIEGYEPVENYNAPGFDNLDNVKKTGDQGEPAPPMSEKEQEKVDKASAEAENGTTRGFWGRTVLSAKVMEEIRRFAGGDDTYSSIKSFKIDNNGCVYVNDTLVSPTLDTSGMPPVVRARIDKNQWGEYLIALEVKKLRYLTEIDIAGNRSATFGKEIGIGPDLTKLKTLKNKAGFKLENKTIKEVKKGTAAHVGFDNSIMQMSRADRMLCFPLLESIKIDGRECEQRTETQLQTQTNAAIMAEKIQAADNEMYNYSPTMKLWNNCLPLKLATKAFGYSIGIQAFWALSAIAGPVGLLFAGIGTAAVALHEYDMYNVDRQEAINRRTGGNGYNAKQIGTSSTSSKNNSKKGNSGGKKQNSKPVDVQGKEID